jgi:hypothetical protein
MPTHQFPETVESESVASATRAQSEYEAELLADLTPEEEERFAEAVRRRSLFGGRQAQL